MVSLDWFLCLTLVGFFSITGADYEVFQTQEEAAQILRRTKRANFMLVEEILKGNLERECHEELCTYEEAREVFEDTDKTNKFWAVYKDGDQCSPNPCQHGGTCTDQVGGYECKCMELYRGANCETDVSQCTIDEPHSCEQFCHPESYNTFVCSCTSGYQLHSDGRSCIPKVKFPCGKGHLLAIPEGSGKARSSEAEALLCPQGQCPWQAMLINEDNQVFCSGAVLGQYWVVTTASCIPALQRFYVSVGGPTKGGEGQGRMLNVSRFVAHARYSAEHPANDLALLRLETPLEFSRRVFPICLPEKDFAENVLMLGTGGVIGGPKVGGAGGRNASLLNRLSYLPLESCRERHNFTVTNKMFCMEGPGEGGCDVKPGSPVITSHKGTSFLTGILTSPPSGYDCSQGYVFNKVSRHLSWINQHTRTST
ncbi:protein Z, vitamin K-dependent plasma glycoprotein b [Lepisosteus oculatus]|uniref:protein Z, vitamin K-dependent plasma glycoprotein b n=1 Tax=Lepisosteus oculatus TaxID=7918 RepID=UPI0035F514E4